MSDRPKIWTVSEAQRLALHRRIKAAFERIPLVPYETVRLADVRFGVLPSVEVPPGEEVRVSVARFDPSIPGILFFGPLLIRHTGAVIETIALHEWAHAWLWVMGESCWHVEYYADEAMRSWGIDPSPLERVRFHSTGRSMRRFLSVSGDTEIPRSLNS